jgi:hypothetical protein
MKLHFNVHRDTVGHFEIKKSLCKVRVLCSVFAVFCTIGQHSLSDTSLFSSQNLIKEKKINMAPERSEFTHLQLDLHPIPDFGRVVKCYFWRLWH